MKITLEPCGVCIVEPCPECGLCGLKKHGDIIECILCDAVIMEVHP